MMKRNGHLSIHDTSISVWEEHVDADEMKFHVYGPLIRFLRDRGFKVHRDPEAKRRWRCISQTKHIGALGDLEVYVDLSGRCLKVEFFQNLSFENRNGGRYDFDKFKRMPYLMKKRFLLEVSAILTHLVGEHGYSFGKKLAGVTPAKVLESIRGASRVQNPLRGFNDKWGSNRFKRDETGWPVPAEYDYGYNKDREGISLRNGMKRWFRGYDGYLKFGTIYTNMGERWQVIYGPGRNDTTWVSSGELFTLQTDDCRRRSFPESTRKKKLTAALDKAVREMRFERAASIRDALFGSREQALENLERGDA